MGRLTFITGGQRSGKSSFAVKLASARAERVVFVATCIPKDDEMKARIEQHKKARPRHWRTIVAEKEISSLLAQLRGCDLVIIDCLTLLVSNYLIQGESEEAVLQEAKRIVETAKRASFETVIVSNQVGWGVIPTNPLARKFVDTLGKVNQIVAKYADEVILVVCGIPLKLKPDLGERR